MVRFKLRNKFVGWDGVKRAVLEVNPPPAGTIGPTQFSGVTDNGGSVRLDLRTLADGEHTVRITPKHWSIDPVGPATAGGSNPPDRIYRPLQFRITTAQGQVVSTQPPARPEWGSAERVNGREVRVKLQPVYVQANSHSPRAGDVTMIVMRRTSGDWIGSAINHFVSTSNNTSAHYIVDLDGQIVKMVQDTRAAHHAGRHTYWAGNQHISGRSIGIEMLNRRGVFEEAQFVSLLELYQRLYSALPKLQRSQIAGHMEVRTTAGGVLGDNARIACPGLGFRWPRLEARGHGRIPWSGPINIPAHYDGYFDQFAGADLRQGDNDATHRLGGGARNGFAGSPVAELQRKLASAWYSVGTIDGRYNAHTHGAVLVFQMHFFADGRGHKRPDGRADVETVSLLQRLL